MSDKGGLGIGIEIDLRLWGGIRLGWDLEELCKSFTLDYNQITASDVQFRAPA